MYDSAFPWQANINFVRHVAPAPPGSTVTVTSRLTEVNGNKLVFEVSCSLGDKVIGSGTHKRAIVPANF